MHPFSPSSTALVYGSHLDIVQGMLDYDYLCGRNPSVQAIFSTSANHKQYKVFFGDQELFIPTIQHRNQLEQFPQITTLINLASFRSCTAVTKAAIKSGRFKHIFTIAEGVAERETRELISLGQEADVDLYGPAIVGALIAGVYRIAHTGGSLENIIQSRLTTAGSVAILAKSGGMMNELCRIVSETTDGVHSAYQIGGDRFPMMRFAPLMEQMEHDPAVQMIVLLGEVGNRAELEVAELLATGTITKPVVAYCIGTAAEEMTQTIQFGHAGAQAITDEETATHKNTALRDAGAHVPETFAALPQMLAAIASKHAIASSESADKEDIEYKLRILRGRRKTRFTSSISDERGDELTYAGQPISELVEEGSLGKVIGLLWLKRELPDYACIALEKMLIVLADHGPAVSGATTTIVTARAGKDLVSSVIAGLATIGPRFGGAIDAAARRLVVAVDEGKTAQEIIQEHQQHGRYIPGIGHSIKSAYAPDVRCQLLAEQMQAFPTQDHFHLAKQVEELTLEKKPSLILNVDGHIAAMVLDMLVAIGMSNEEIQEIIHAGMANGLFVLGRSIGLIGHYLDQQRLQEGLYRTPSEDILYME